MKTTSSQEVSGLLIAWSNGDQEALNRLIPLVYQELRRMAARHMRRERPGHTLQTSALVNETYLKLVDQKNMRWQNRAHFFGVAAQLMRRVLVDYARTRIRIKRGGHLTKVSLDETAVISMDKTAEFIVLDDALTELAEIDPQKSRIVEMKIFCGLNEEEIAVVEKVSPRTIRREWRRAKARGVDLTKISNSGIIQWRRSVTSRDYFFRSIAATRGNGIIVVGTSKESNKLKIVKLKANGTLDWKAAYSFPVSIIISLSNPIQTVDGNYVFSGTISLPKDKYYGFIVNIGSSRKVEFQYVFRSAPSPFYIQRSSGRSVFAAKDGGFVLFDTGTESELIIIKMNSEGILPGCGFLETLNPIQRIPFGVLKNRKSEFDYSELILEPKNFELRSLASNQPESSVCK